MGTERKSGTSSSYVLCNVRFLALSPDVEQARFWTPVRCVVAPLCIAPQGSCVCSSASTCHGWGVRGEVRSVAIAGGSSGAAPTPPPSEMSSSHTSPFGDGVWSVRALQVLLLSLLKGMDMALSKVNSGGWVHIFSEGNHSMDEGKIVAPVLFFKRILGNRSPSVCLCLQSKTKKWSSTAGSRSKFIDWLRSSILNSKTTMCDYGYQLRQLFDWEGFGIGSLSYSHCRFYFESYYHYKIDVVTMFVGSFGCSRTSVHERGSEQDVHFCSIC